MLPSAIVMEAGNHSIQLETASSQTLECDLPEDRPKELGGLAIRRPWKIFRQRSEGEAPQTVKVATEAY